MKKLQKAILTAALVLLTAVLMSVFAFADETGYTRDKGGNETNIKWTTKTEDKDIVCTFEIDESATDKTPSTVIHGIDPVTGKAAAWSSPIQNGWGQLTGVTTVIIKEGITGLEGGVFDLNRTVKKIELPKSLTSIVGEGTFQGTSALTCVYTAGETPEEGTLDFNNIASITQSNYVFDNSRAASKIKFSETLTGEFQTEFIKSVLFTEFTVPAGVTKLAANAISQSKQLATLTIMGKDTEIDINVFSNMESFPAIKAFADSKAAEFAKANGYTFINLETGEKTDGTKPTTGEATSDGTTSGGTTSGGTTSKPSEPLEEMPENITAQGHITGSWQGTPIYDTNWAYVASTKTLYFISCTKSYNETGRIDKSDDKIGWQEYKDEIEHIVVGSYINKVTGKALMNHKGLIDVELGPNVTQIDADAFNGCTSLTTIYRKGGERKEGTADFSNLGALRDNVLKETAVTDIILPKKTTAIEKPISMKLQNIYTYNMTEALIAYAKENFYNIIDVANSENKHEFSVFIDTTLPSCGDRAVFDFDEATGVLTIKGVGAMGDITNYYGGGSKNQPWFDIKNNVKHIVITEHISSIGRYAFCEFKNLETVQIPDSENFEISNAAFEKCYNLKSIYRTGTEAIEGFADLRNQKELSTFILAYDYLIANVAINPEVSKIGSSVFEENTNLAGIYGTPASYAEEYAKANNLTFYDISANTPAPVKCTPPETSADESTAAVTVAVTETEAETTVSAPETESAESTGMFNFDDTDAASDIQDNKTGGGNTVLIIVIAAVAAVVIIAGAVIFAMKKKVPKK